MFMIILINHSMDKSKNRTMWYVLVSVGLALFVAIITLLLDGNNVVLLNPKGFIAEAQYELMLNSTIIMVLFAAPILSILYYFAWKYRESNNKVAKEFSQKESGNIFYSFAIWGAPTLIAVLLAAIMIPATHKLEPKKLIASDKPTMTVQVVALRWKWLFIYPEQNIATVNFVQVPKDTPVQFELTADETPMSSFWIPSLGGMLYAMTEHVNRLNLIGDTIGDFEGSAAEINGTGFADMRFTARVSTEPEFEEWAESIRKSPTKLTMAEYENLLKPSKNNEMAFFSKPSTDLYSTILSKYAGSHGMNHQSHMEYDNKKHEGHTGH